jgi:hypothetical protein
MILMPIVDDALYLLAVTDASSRLIIRQSSASTPFPP